MSELAKIIKEFEQSPCYKCDMISLMHSHTEEQRTIDIKSGEYRPCVINGVKALFHRWADTRRVLSL